MLLGTKTFSVSEKRQKYKIKKKSKTLEQENSKNL